MRYPIEPVAKPRMTRRDKWKKRPCVMRYRRFKDQCRAHRVELPQPCKVVFHLPMPNSWPVSMKASFDGQPHGAKLDLDNLLKGLFDAVCKDDQHLWSVRAEKRWAREGSIEIIALEDE